MRCTIKRNLDRHALLFFEGATKLNPNAKYSITRNFAAKVLEEHNLKIKKRKHFSILNNVMRFSNPAEVCYGCQAASQRFVSFEGLTVIPVRWERKIIFITHKIPAYRI